ncbi:MAG TPA: site-2 protease family protein [Beijerinckiaceae bacterium]|jgi:Zn-dependent protease
MEQEYWIAAAIGLAVLAYAAFVNRKVQRYRGRTVFEATAAEVWELIDIRPGRPCWMQNVKAVTWIDEASRDMEIALHTGQGMRQRILLVEEPRRHEAMVAYRWSPKDYGDVAYSRCTLAEADGRTELRTELAFERRGLFNGLAHRFVYPFQIAIFHALARQELQRRASERSLPWGRPAPALETSAQRIRRGLFRWPVLLAAATVAWLAYEFGLLVGLSLLIMLLVHEYGHVWSMRRHGHAAPRILLIPFFGGVAVGNRIARSDAEDAEIALMGPAFGIVPGLAALAAYGMTGQEWLAAVAFFLVIVNLFNLIPFPPLDGGQVTRTLLRPLGPKVAAAVSGLLILAGMAAALYLKAPVLMIFFVIGALAWIAAPLPPERRPLRAMGLTLAAASYVGLVAAHLAALTAAIALTDAEDIMALLETAPKLF